ncbi:MAG: hypothetical protein CMI27_04625 [Opitutae bacterium]|mgnify:CR=1 FL=1|nr:hypothetical protein [Opitutae bacterium]
MIRSALLNLCMLAGNLIAETLPPLSADKVPQSVEELWATYDPDKEPLEVTIVREWIEDGCVVRFITYTIGTFKGQRSTMAAFYAAPEKPDGKIPALIQMHGGGQRASIASAKYGAENGYACLSINWGGREMENAQPGDPTTDWGAVDATQTGHNSHYSKLTPDHLTLDPFESPRNNNWFLITLAARRGVSYLQQQPEVDDTRIGAFGHSMGGYLTVMLAGADRRIKAGAPSCGGSGSAPDAIRNRPNSGVRRKHSKLYHQTCDDAAYLKHIRAPMLYMGPQNDFNGILDNMYENWKSMPSKHIGYTVNPHMNHRATAEHVFPSMLWFDDHLKGTFDFPRTPELKVDLTTGEGVPTASVTPDQIDKVAKVEIYYSVDNHILSRFWRSADSRRTGDTWEANLPVTSEDQALYVIANVYYQLDHKLVGYPWMREPPETFGVTSELRTFTPAELRSAGVRGDKHRERMLQDQFDYLDWYQLNWENPHAWSAYTRKIKDPRFIGPDGASLAMDIQVNHDTTFLIHARNNTWGAYPEGERGEYYAPVVVKASPDWQTIGVELKDFQPTTSKTKAPLMHWRHVTELGLCGRLKAERDGKAVMLPENVDEAKATYRLPRRFKNLRWEGGSWPPLSVSLQAGGQQKNTGITGFDEEFQQAIDESIALEAIDERAAENGKIYLRKEMASQVQSYWRVLNDKGVQGKGISVGGKTYERGLGVHADSKISFPLDDKFSSFHAVPGPDDAHRGRLEMRILLDGEEVYASGKVRSVGFVVRPVTIPLNKAKELTLLVTDGGDGRGGDHASWANAYLTKKAAEAKPADGAQPSHKPLSSSSLRLDVFPPSTLRRSAEPAGTARISTTFTPSGSVWDRRIAESQVFQYELTSRQPADSSYRLRMGRGGQLYSLRGAFGESVPPSWRDSRNDLSPWTDEVWQFVAVCSRYNGTSAIQGAGIVPEATAEKMRNSPYKTTFFVHNSGTYVPRGSNFDSLYCPLLDSDANPADRSIRMLNWGLIPQVRTVHRSPLLFYTRVRDLGDGVIELTWVAHNFSTRKDVVFDHLNAPWGGTRPSSLPIHLISTPEGKLVNRSDLFGDKPDGAVDVQRTGGWNISSISEAEDSPSLAFVFGRDRHLETEQAKAAKNQPHLQFAPSQLRDMRAHWQMYDPENGKWNDWRTRPENSFRNYDVAVVIPKFKLAPGRSIWYRSYLIVGRKEKVAAQAASLVDHVDYGLSEFNPGETPMVPVSVRGNRIVTQGGVEPSATTFHLFARPVPGSAPVFAIRNSTTGQTVVTSDPYFFVPQHPLGYELPRDHPHHDYFAQAQGIALDEATCEWQSLLGFGCLQKPETGAWQQLSDLLDATTFPPETQNHLDLWIPAADREE